MNPFLHSTIAVPDETLVANPVAPGRSVLSTTRGRFTRLVLGAACLAVCGWAQAVDVNSAQLHDLRKVQGIGPKTAQLIIDERERGGPYESLSDLSDRVKGIGPKKAARLGSAGLVVGSAGTAATAAAAGDGAVAQAAADTSPSPSSRLRGFFAR
jgi:competence protein ComEA